LIKFLVTTSHRPTRNTRRFTKFISMILPNFIRVNRGKLTLSMLALQAIDMNIDKVVIIRNRKGNPGYIDIYNVDYLNNSLRLLCTLKICGYSSFATIRGGLTKKRIFNGIVLNLDIEEGLDKSEMDKALECLAHLFPLIIQKPSDNICRQNNYLFVNIRKNVKNGIYEVKFQDCSRLLGILKICT